MFGKYKAFLAKGKTNCKLVPKSNKMENIWEKSEKQWLSFLEIQGHHQRDAEDQTNLEICLNGL